MQSIRVAIIIGCSLLLASLGGLAIAQDHVLIVGARGGFEGKSIREQLEKILHGAGMQDSIVGLIGPGEEDQKNLSGWYYDPDHDANKRRSTLRGEAGTVWRHVVILENPEVIESFPGWYAQGIHDIATEVEKGKGKAALLMQWPAADSKSTLDYYKEVSYRVGRGRGVVVIPAGLALEAIRSTKEDKLKKTDAAYIAAASIFSCLFDQNAAASTDAFNKEFANKVHQTVVKNRGAIQYSGPFVAAPNGIHSIVGNQNRILRMINDGWRSRGYPLETVNNWNNWALTEKMGLINRRTAKEQAGAASGLARNGTPNDHADLHYVASTPMRETTAKIYVSRLQNYIRNQSAQACLEAVKNDYSKDSIGLGRLWLDGNQKLRQVPAYLLASQIHMHLQPKDAEELDLHKAIKPCYAAHMVTLLTGRCPLDLDSVGTDRFEVQRIGYETAWRFSTLHGRAPGFITRPDTPLRMTVDAEQGASLSAAFALPPQSKVKVKVSTTDASVRVSPQELVFSPENHLEPQTITLKAAKEAKPGTSFEVIFTTASEDVVCDGLNASWAYVVNTAPTAEDLEAEAFSDQMSSIRLLGKDADEMSTGFEFEPPPPFTEPISYHVVRRPANGRVEIGGSVAAYTPDPDFVGEDNFTYRSKDFSTFSEEATVTIKVNNAPLYDRNLLANGSAELAPFTQFGWFQQEGAWRQFPDAKDGLHAFGPDKKDPLAVLHQDLDVSKYADQIAAGNQRFRVSGYGASINDEAKVFVSFMDSQDKVLKDDIAIPMPKMMDAFEDTFTAPPSCTSIRVLLHAQKGKGTNGCRFDGLRLEALDPSKPNEN